MLREMTKAQLDGMRLPDGRLPKYTGFGGYPLYYLAMDSGTLCPDCANGDNGSECTNPNLDPGCPDDHQWILAGCEVNWEDPDMHCAHCQQRIESAYAEEGRS